MLARQTTNTTNNLCTLCGRRIGFCDLLGAALGRRQCQVALIPPIQFSHIIYTRFLEPRRITQRYEEMAIGMFLRNSFYSRQRQMIVMIMRYYNHIDNGNFANVARRFGVSLRTEPGKWRASVFKHRIEKNSKTTGEFGIEAGMS